MRIKVYIWGSRIWRGIASIQMRLGASPRYAMNRSADMILRAAEIRVGKR